MLISIIRDIGKIRTRDFKGKLTIGIIGTHVGAGSTHFAILLSNYLSECLGMKTAYIECFPQKELIYMEEIYDLCGKATSTRDYFSLYKVRYYKSIREEKIPKIMSEGFDCLVLDLGVDINKMKNEFLRCDKRIVISNLAPWKSNKVEEFLAKTGFKGAEDNLEFGISFTTDRFLKDSSRHFKIPFFSIPYEPDPFALSNNTIKMFQKII